MISPIYPQNARPKDNPSEILSKLNSYTGSNPVGDAKSISYFTYPFCLPVDKFFYPQTIPNIAGLPLLVRVTRSYQSPEPGTLRAVLPQPPTDRVKNRPDARGRSAAANPIWQPGALGTIFALPAQTPGVHCPWGFAL
jgi:hypothetical protein